MDIKDVAHKYFNEYKSIQEIASEYNSYSGKVSKLLKDNGYTLRTKAESQKLVLEQGKSKHPTKGMQRSEEEKLAISKGNHKVWSNLTEEERLIRSKIGKDNWEKLTDKQKEEFLKKGQEAVRKAAKEGSLMEQYLFEILNDKYDVIMHKKGLVANEKLEVDLYITDLNTIIEVDGPAHFEDLWNDGTAKRNIRADNDKTTLFLNKGFTVIRLKDLRQNKSQIYFKQSGEKVLEILEKVKNKKLGKFIEVDL